MREKIYFNYCWHVTLLGLIQEIFIFVGREPVSHRVHKPGKLTSLWYYVTKILNQLLSDLKHDVEITGYPTQSLHFPLKLFSTNTSLF